MLEDNIRYTEVGQGPCILILHGLFGSLSNFESMMQLAKEKYRFIMPHLPLYDCDLSRADLDGMMVYLENFIESFGLINFSILGNSLGGHLALLYTLKNPHRVQSLILTASSGLFESSLGNEYPKRNRDFLRTKILETFGNKSLVTDELVSDIEQIVSSKSKALRILKLAKSATRQNLLNTISSIRIPTLLIWGKNDIITPPFVAERFHQLLENSQLVWIDNCGHAPMMEYPEKFTELMVPFLDKIYA